MTDWYMVRSKKSGEWRGPLLEDDAKKLAVEMCQKDQQDVELFSIHVGEPRWVARWAGVTMDDMSRLWRGGPNDR